jgi:hypothetical protein
LKLALCAVAMLASTGVAAAATWRFVDTQRQLAAIGPRPHCGTCMMGELERIGAKPEVEVPMRSSRRARRW